MTSSFPYWMARPGYWRHGSRKLHCFPNQKIHSKIKHLFLNFHHRPRRQRDPVFRIGRLSRRGKIPGKVKHLSKEKRSTRPHGDTGKLSVCVKEEDQKKKIKREVKYKKAWGVPPHQPGRLGGTHTHFTEVESALTSTSPQVVGQARERAKSVLFQNATRNWELRGMSTSFTSGMNESHFQEKMNLLFLSPHNLKKKKLARPLLYDSREAHWNSWLCVCVYLVDKGDHGRTTGINKWLIKGPLASKCFSMTCRDCNHAHNKRRMIINGLKRKLVLND